MHPILFNIPIINRPVHSFGLMLVIGLIGALQLAKYLAKRHGLNPELFVNAGLIALATGVLGARFMHVFENWSAYTRSDLSVFQNLKNMLDVSEGGLTFYGGLILAFPCCVAYAVWKKVPLRLGMDIVAPCLMIGLGVGRIGCFLNGCCEGAACELPWAVSYPYASNPYNREASLGQLTPPPALMTATGPELYDGQRNEPNRAFTQSEIDTYTKRSGDATLMELSHQERSGRLHPSQLYSTFTALLLAGVCVAYMTVRHAPGQVMGLMLTLEGASRFVLETLRVEPAVEHVGGVGFSISMLIGLLICGIGIGMWLILGYVERRQSTRLSLA